MAEIISFAEIQRARRRARAPERASLEQALQILRENLANAARMLADAAPREQPELLTRVEHLASMVRYGMRMLGTDPSFEEPTSIER
ncbi:MAG TPA: hypothetical protein VMA09_06115 [Candidatus Binataceae bacterium]|nr:hypothetical protein [Candidatus Binataceae bacterium]